MALQFERNVNLEEIDSDAVLGIKYLSHQTLLQKAIFWGCVVIAVVFFLMTQLFAILPFILSFFVSMLFAGIGFLFGANQNENLTIAQYVKLLFFKPVRYVDFKSTEDIYLMQDEAIKIKEEEEARKKREQSASPESQRRLLIIFITMCSLIVVIFIAGMSVKAYKNSHFEHHTIGLYIPYEMDSYLKGET